MSRALLTRSFAATTAIAVATGVIVQLVSTSHAPPVLFDTRGKQVANVFCFFTILSNLLLGATSAALAVTLDRRGRVFSALRLGGVLSMIVTGVVYWVALHGLQDLHGTAAVANLILHTINPILAVLGWLVVGPRGVIDGRVVGLTVIYPIAWLVFTLIRGAIINFYPYPFLNATDHGYARVIVNCLVVAVLFLGLAFGASGLDRFIPASEPSSRPGGH